MKRNPSTATDRFVMFCGLVAIFAVLYGIVSADWGM